MARWEVLITFTDGIYRELVFTSTKERAYQMALQDARMGSSSGAFYGEVVSWSVT
jgi:ABC-type thiamin/hydroxymethylpyrimidine transport system permease subunit